MPKLKRPNVDRRLRIAAKLETVLRDTPGYKEYMKAKPRLHELKDFEKLRLVENLLHVTFEAEHVNSVLVKFFDKKKKYENTYLDIYTQMFRQCHATRKQKTYDIFLVCYYLYRVLPKDHPLCKPTTQNYNSHFGEYFENGSDMYEYDEDLAKDGFNSYADFVSWEIQRQLDKPD